MTTENTVSVRKLEIHEWETYSNLRLRSLADSPDAFGSTLAAEQERSPEAWAARLSAAAVSGKDYPLVAEIAGTAAGLVWAKVDADDESIVNIFQMWVAPESRGRGAAAALLRTAILWAKDRNARLVRLGVACGDTPAVRLYVREGFRDVGEPEPLRAGSPLLSQTMQLAIAAEAA
ncbi:GNAT family N-acetyltransferase [Undibacterium terreum]|uniref:N-acetyltransferase n=1 Tax=Undibacterium terreum TaxID=1224302 RepID=A0A916U9T9_9BURK|nr:GNAT family N-acetyltransferase [Undibacterium terreum]GGC64443.1 N-acetyltransferase [Undibacterium terreum]